MDQTLNTEIDIPALKKDRMKITKQLEEHDPEINPMDFVEVQSEEEDGVLMSTSCQRVPNPLKSVEKSSESVEKNVAETFPECPNSDPKSWTDPEFEILRSQFCRVEKDKIVDDVKRDDGDVDSRVNERDVDMNEESNELTCSECGTKFPNATYLENHKILNHLEAKPFLCYVCSKPFVQKRSLKAHFNSAHHVLGQFECFECATTPFTDEETLKKHISTEHFRSEPYHCVVCGNNYIRRDRLKSHFDAVHAQKKAVQCEKCGKYFSELSKLSNHIATQHFDPSVFECTLCDSKFSKLATLKGHMDTVHCKDRPYKCSLCHYYFSTEGLRKRHIDSVHKDSKPVNCPFCDDKRFAIKRSLFKHVRSVHKLQAMPLKCPKCELFFKDKPALNGHLESSKCGRTPQRPFRCDECDSSFTQRSHFYTHRKSVHKAPKSLKCHLCLVCFSYKNTLNRHLIKFHGLDRSELKACEKSNKD